MRVESSPDNRPLVHVADAVPHLQGKGEGLSTDMNAIRPDDRMDSTHSISVDQQDWEQVIAAKDRTRAATGTASCAP